MKERTREESEAFQRLITLKQGRPLSAFSFLCKINFYDTDAGGVVHHAAHPRILERARIAFIDCTEQAYDRYVAQDVHLVVTEMHLRYRRPMVYGQWCLTKLIPRQEGPRYLIDYELFRVPAPEDGQEGPRWNWEFAAAEENKPAVIAQTVHVFLTGNGDVKRFSDVLELVQQ